MQKESCDAYFEKRLTEGLSDCFTVSLERHGRAMYEFFGTNHRKKEYADFSRETRFNLGSVTKIFTAALLVKLMEAGELSLSDKVRRLIPEFPFEDIELAQLLHHTSGCHVAKPEEISEQKAFLDYLYANVHREGNPDEKMRYWSAGYCILMDVIQRVTGTSLEAFARREIFEKLGMDHTTFLLESIPEDRRIFAVSGQTDELFDFTKLPVTGDSGLYSTCTDLLKFSRDLLDTHKKRSGKVFSPFAVDLMFREVTNGRFDRTPVFWKKSDHRIFSRCAGDLNSPEALYHTGFTGCMLLLEPRYDLSLAIVTNSPKVCLTDSHLSRCIDFLLSRLEA